MSPRSLPWIGALLAISNTVSALPAERKRDTTDWVTATIDGQTVSWVNNWSGSSTPGTDWVTATIDGKTVSWVNDWFGSSTQAVTTTTPTSTQAVTTSTGVITTSSPLPTSVPSSTSSSSSSSSSAPTPTPTNPTCASIHIFLAKGWNEPYPGRQSSLVTAICSGLPSCTYENIQYSNMAGSEFCPAMQEGDPNGLSQMTSYAARCPASKLVLSGYSEGANVVGDILGGGDRADCTSGVVGGLDVGVGPGSNLAAILLFGDPEHAADQSYNVLSGANIGTYVSRNGTSLARMAQFSSIMRSYCDHADPVCAAAGPGPFDVDTHLDYFDLYTVDAAGWVRSLLGY